MGREFLLRRIGALAEGVASCLTPPRCRSCRIPLFNHGNPYLCAGCAAAVEWIGEGACGGCGFPAGPHAAHGANCFRCGRKGLGLTGATAVARYRHGARNLVRAFKYGGETELAGVLGELMAERVKGMKSFAGIDVIVPVALDAGRRRERGFDQAGLLAGAVGRRLGIAWREDVLRRVRRTVPQASLHRRERLGNMEGVFEVVGKEVEGRRVLLVDDVMTTGATMADCARACRAAGAKRVYGAVFAR